MKKHSILAAALLLLTPLVYAGLTLPSTPEGALAQFVVPAGTKRVLDQDLTVYAADGIQIDGIVEVKPGVSLQLFSAGSIEVNGSILSTPLEPATPSSSASLLSSMLPKEANAAPGSADWILYGDQIYISKGATVRTAPGKDLLITTHDAQGRIRIEGKLETADGRDGRNRNENGQDAGSIEVGTHRSADLIKEEGKKFGKKLKTAQPGFVSIAGTVSTGSGGNGYDDLRGENQGPRLLLRGTNGGNGGAILVQAAKIEIAGGLSTGDGGRGGDAGDASHRVTFARRGTKEREKGQDIDFTTGNGGHGGNIEVGEGQEEKPVEVGEGDTGTGGKAGWAYAAAGDGGPSGDGGDTLGKLGDVGDNGTINHLAANSKQPLKAIANLRYGGTGGDSQNPNLPGGNGGKVWVTNHEGKMARLHEQIQIQNYANAGDGFNGCMGATPQNGTNGGNSNVNPYVTLGVLGAPYQIEYRSFHGGRGGDGEPRHGLGGYGGFDDAFKQVGEDGPSGRGCPKPVAKKVIPVETFKAESEKTPPAKIDMKKNPSTVEKSKTEYDYTKQFEGIPVESATSGEPSPETLRMGGSDSHIRTGGPLSYVHEGRAIHKAEDVKAFVHRVHGRK